MPAQVLGPQEGQLVDLGGLGVRFMLDAEQTGGSFSLVEHPMAPRTLGSPIHTHSREDEYSYVLEGRVGLLVGDEVMQATAGDLVLKPRGVPHAFWNAGDEPARLLEVISPAGFESYFAESASLFSRDGPPDMERLAALADRYGLEMDFLGATARRRARPRPGATARYRVADRPLPVSGCPAPAVLVTAHGLVGELAVVPATDEEPPCTVPLAVVAGRRHSPLEKHQGGGELCLAAVG
jgi:quercetin dioxygenase-like cupin family protein